jgi:HTH-type transcriptional regulator, sugar sensing transcriptional regulator
MLAEQLKKAGLNDPEIKVYLASLELGETNISRIAKKSGIKRTTTYLVVDSLKEKGLMNALKKKNKTFFHAEDPRKIKEQMEENIKEIDLAIPELLAIANFIDKKPNIKFYEGKNGIKDLFKDILKYPDSEVLELYSESYVTDFEEEFFTNYFTPKRVAKKIWVRAILPDNEIIRKLIIDNEKQLRQTKLLSPKKYNIRIEINLYGKNKVSIISFKEEMGLIIESQKIYESLRNIFEILWEDARY